mmetsp:Transcript_80462/g.204552  ORF Transcript_80462/g.204552 Transcript_80462/m.204552 type:complete len:103 (+) Transcript_80462:404-712(+)
MLLKEGQPDGEKDWVLNSDGNDDSDEAVLEKIKDADPEKMSVRSMTVLCEDRESRTRQAAGLTTELAGRKRKGAVHTQEESDEKLTSGGRREPTPRRSPCDQ